MTHDPSDDASATDSGDDYSDRELARLVDRYLTSPDAVSDDELRTHLRGAVRGRLVDLARGDTGVSVVVERPSESGERPVRESYVVRPVTDLDGEPSLDWSYLGPAEEG